MKEEWLTSSRKWSQIIKSEKSGWLQGKKERLDVWDVCIHSEYDLAKWEFERLKNKKLCVILLIRILIIDYERY